jgi:hypothetical protein
MRWPQTSEEAAESSHIPGSFLREISMIRVVAAAATLALLTGAALAGTDMNFPTFTGINVHGGGSVVLRHGPVQRVTVIKGDMSKIDLHMSGNTLDISPCKKWLSCWGSNPLEVEIVSPKIENFEIHGGGELKAVGDFPKQPTLRADVHGGGDLDCRAIPADSVTANVHGGGDAYVNAISSINAEVHGGGDLTYTGNPPHISSQTHGGGSIHKQ